MAKTGRPHGAKDKKPRGTPSTRAGKRKCKRCKVVWNRPKGDSSGICPRCKAHCSRCDVLLTRENVSDGCKKSGRYRCKVCIAYLARLGPQPSPEKTRESRLNLKFGITIPEYDAMLKSQGGVCYICEQPPTGNRLAVDHQHVKGDNKKYGGFARRKRVRGLLCWTCNSSIAKFKDDPARLRKAATYLEVWPALAVLKEKIDG